MIKKFWYCWFVKKCKKLLMTVPRYTWVSTVRKKNLYIKLFCHSFTLLQSPHHSLLIFLFHPSSSDIYLALPSLFSNNSEPPGATRRPHLNLSPLSQCIPSSLSDRNERPLGSTLYTGKALFLSRTRDWWPSEASSGNNASSSYL